MEIALLILKIILITVGCIVGLIALAAILILAAKARIIFGYNKNDGFILKVKYSFLTLDILPSKRKTNENKGKEPKTIPKKEGKRTNTKETRPEKSGGGTLDSLKKKFSTMKFENYTDLLSFIPPFIGKFKFEVIKLNIAVATPSAADTAIRYGKLTAIIFPILGIINNTGRSKSIDAHISTDFTKEKTEINFYFDFGVRTVHAVILLLKAFVYISKIKENKYGK